MFNGKTDFSHICLWYLSIYIYILHTRKLMCITMRLWIFLSLVPRGGISYVFLGQTDFFIISLFGIYIYILHTSKLMCITMRLWIFLSLVTPGGSIGRVTWQR